MMHRELVYAIVCGLLTSQSAGAQRGAVPVRGVVFDSLRGQPLRNAFVSIGGKTEVITTDSRGRFQFDSVEPGSHQLTAQHPLLDSIGLSGLSAHTTITDGRDEVRIAVPSFATLWAVACGGGRVPNDSGIVYGTIRDASGGAPVANATVELSWSDLVLDKKRHVVQRRWQVQTRSNAVGGYAACGVAPDIGLRLHARTDSTESGAIDLPPLATRVQRRDLLVASSASDSSHGGTITGVVTDQDGRPLADARILVDQVPAVRSDADGRFILSSVPAGTRQIEVFAIGAVPVLEIADVMPGKSSTIGVTLHRVHTLEAVRATAGRTLRVAATEFDARRKQGFGYTRDSTDMLKYDQFVSVLRDVPSLTVQYRGATLGLSFPDGKGRSCAPDVLIDGAVAGFGNLIDLMPAEVGGLEVYPRAAHIPPRFVPPGIHPQCGMVLVWTKYGLRNR
jgi:protocatechuate 3,4-dioxygenase beta subunit